MRATLLTLIALITVSATTAAMAADKQARLEKVRDRISAIKAQMVEDREARSDHVAALANIENKISDIASRLTELDNSIARAQQRVAALSKHVEQQRRQLDHQSDQLATQIRAAYRVGRQSPLQLILSQENPAMIGRLLGYYEYYAKAQSDAIADVRAKLDDLREARAERSEQQQRLQQKRSERRAILARLKATRTQREATLQAIEQRLAQRGDTLEQLRADAQRLTNLIGSLHESLAPLPPPSPHKPFAQRKGTLSTPVHGQAIAQFGDNKAGGRLQWEGKWIAAPAGTPVSAVAPGRVVYVGWMYHYGLMVVLDHGDNFYTVYGHNQSVFVRVGEQVRAGEKLSSAGTSGGHDTAGVYFEIRHGTTPLDPGDWLRD